jgi:hypothetical protein
MLEELEAHLGRSGLLILTAAKVAILGAQVLVPYLVLVAGVQALLMAQAVREDFSHKAVTPL